MAASGRPSTALGIDFAVALELIAAMHRFASPQKLVSYLGLEPRVRQSGNGSSMAIYASPRLADPTLRGMIVEAAWATAGTPRPFRAFFDGIHRDVDLRSPSLRSRRSWPWLVWYPITRSPDHPRTGLPFIKDMCTDTRPTGSTCPVLRDETSLTRRSRRVAAVARSAPSPVVCHWPIATVLVGYVATALLVPTLANVAVTDDWVYYRSVEELITAHRLYVHEMSSAALVFQTVWGAAFAWFLGLSFGVLRVSTVVVVGVSGLAFYAVCRELGVSHGWSAVGTAAYVFHPLTLSLAYTFMTDPHYTALVVISTWMYVRGLARSTRPVYVVAGSMVAAFALLVRQQGVLLPLGVAAGLLVARRLSPSWWSIGLIAQVGAIPALALVGYTVWLRAAQGVPWALGLFWAELAAAGWLGVATSVPRLAGTESVYLGLFVLPVALGAVPAVLALARPLTPWWRLAVTAWAALVLAAAIVFGLAGRFMPYAGQFITPTGLGPEDLLAARPIYLEPLVRQVLTALSCLAAIVAGLAVARQAQRSSTHDRTGILLVLGIAVLQVVGTVVPSIHFIQWEGTLDRYLLPLLPLVLVLVLWSVRDVRLSATVVGVTLVAGSLFAIAGTRDNLAFLDTVWSVAREATILGVPETHLDAGAGWDGFYLFEGPPTGTEPHHPGAPWWIDLFAPSVDPQYVVSGAPLPGYSVVLEGGYRSWLRFRALPIYLLRRPDVAGPP